MVFSSAIFLFAFFPLLAGIYFLAKQKYRNYILLLFSLVFYAWGEPKFVLVMIFMIIIDYLAAILIGAENNVGLRRFTLICAVAINLGILMYFKYANFLVENLNRVLKNDVSIDTIILPIGISFFTFQALSYVIDVYRKEVEVQKNPLYLMLYVALFPQLIAGPIVRYKTVEQEINSRIICLNDICQGVERFIIGFAKKVIIANRVGELADTVYAMEIHNIKMPVMWMGAIAYMLQIYFDFSAYSDMAIGLGRIFGFHFEENFDYPYISSTITEFWRRWHISLSTWFRDYVYIPLGGNRKGKKRQIVNLFIVWALTGIWHGAEWNFVFWGIYYFVFLIIEKIFLLEFIEKRSSLFMKVIQHIYTLLVVLVGWVLFRATSLSDCIQYIKILFVPQGESLETAFELCRVYFVKYGIYMILGCLTSIPICRKIRGGGYTTKIAIPESVKLLIRYLLLLMLFGLTILYLTNSTYNPFIYFRF